MSVFTSTLAGLELTIGAVELINKKHGCVHTHAPSGECRYISSGLLTKLTLVGHRKSNQ